MTISGAKELEPLIHHFIKLSLEGKDRYNPQVFKYGVNSQRKIEMRAGSSENQRQVKYIFLLKQGETKNIAIYPAIYLYPEYLLAFSAYGIGDMIRDEYKNFPYFDNIPTIKSYFDEQDVNIASDIKSKATRYDYLHNKYKNAYSIANYTALNPAVSLANDMVDMCLEFDK